MKKRNTILTMLLAILMVFAFAACNDPKEDLTSGNGDTPTPGNGGTPTPTPTFSISGTVTDAETGNPISGAAVELQISLLMTILHTTTAANGTYSFSDVKAGPYIIAVIMEGYHIGVINNVVVSNANVTGKDLQLVDKSIPISSVSGTITSDEHGGALEGATVTLKQGNVEKGSATTDAQGKYTIINIHEGLYTIEVSKSGYRTGKIEFVYIYGNETGNDLILHYYTLPYVVNLTITSQPDQKLYINDTNPAILNTQGLIVMADYSDGTNVAAVNHEELSFTYTLLSSPDNDTGEMNEITPPDNTFYLFPDTFFKVNVILDDGAASFKIFSINPESYSNFTGLDMEKEPEKTSYLIGEELDLTGLKLLGKWSGLSDVSVWLQKEWLDVTGFDSSASGEQTVTLSFTDVNFTGSSATKSTSFTVTVE